MFRKDMDKRLCGCFLLLVYILRDLCIEPISGLSAGVRKTTVL